MIAMPPQSCTRSCNWSLVKLAAHLTAWPTLLMLLMVLPATPLATQAIGETIHELNR
jgi:predicted metal-binding membrane protein